MNDQKDYFYYKNTNNVKYEIPNVKQYTEKPLQKKDVYGSSSKAIFKFMTTDKKYICFDEYKYSYPYDSDDFGRNISLLLWYPEWKERLIEMGNISNTWEKLVKNWDNIEKLYNDDYIKYGNDIYQKTCCAYIASLIE